MKIYVYLLITNPLLYENIVNLFEHDIETKMLFELIKQPFENFLVFVVRLILWTLKKILFKFIWIY